LITPTVIVTDDAGNDVTGAGTGVWTGPPGVDPMTGIFIVPGQSAVPYTLVYNYTDATGCPGINTIDINIFDEPSSAFSIDDSDLCLGDELNITIVDFQNGSTYDLIIDADQSTYMQTDNPDGSYTIVFTDDPGGDVDITLQTFAGTCESPVTEMTVTVLAPLEFTLTDLVECYNVDSGEIVLEALDMNGDPVDGSWEIENEGPLPGNLFSPTVNNTTYVLIFTEENCGEQGSMEVEVVEKPTLQITPQSQTVCIDDPINVTIESNFYDEIMHTGLNGTPDDPPLSGLEPDFTLAFQNPGTYTYESVIDRTGDCDSDVIEWEIIVEGPPEMPVMNTCVQTLNSVEFSWTTVPCAENYTIIYNGPNGEVIVGDIDETSYLIDNLEQGDEIEITIVINSNCACDFPDALSQTCNAQACEPATITFVDSPDSEYCLSGPPAPFQISADVTGIDIDLSGDFTYSGDGVDADGMFDPSGLADGDYSILLEYSEDGCFYSESLDFSILPSPAISVDVVNAPCPESTEGMVNIAGIGTAPFDFSTDVATLSEGENTVDVGSYTVTVTDANGCTSETTFTVGQEAAPLAVFNVPDEAFTEQLQTFQFDLSTSPDSVIWTIGDTIVSMIDCLIADCSSFQFTPLSEIVYEVCIEAFYGDCTYIECRDMEAEELQINNIYIPNIFNPSNVTDPINTTWKMYVEGYDLVIKDFAIYDRWGNIVHRGDDNGPKQVIGLAAADESIVELWDGVFNGGTDFVPGVYVYLLELEILEDDDRSYTEFISGSVTIID